MVPSLVFVFQLLLEKDILRHHLKVEHSCVLICVCSTLIIHIWLHVSVMYDYMCLFAWMDFGVVLSIFPTCEVFHWVWYFCLELLKLGRMSLCLRHDRFTLRPWCLMPFRPTSCLSVQICLQLIQHDCKNKLIGFVLGWTYNIFNCLVVSIISGTMESQETFVTNRSLYHCSITALSLLYHCSITLLSPKYLRLMDMVWVQWTGLRPQLVDFCFRLSAPSWIVGALSLFNGLSQSHLQGSKILNWVVPHSTSYSVCTAHKKDEHVLAEQALKAVKALISHAVFQYLSAQTKSHHFIRLIKEWWSFLYGCVWKCCVPHCTQWFCWSLSLWKMASSLGIYPTCSDKPI